MLRQIDKNIWVAEQPLKYWGIEVGTRMTIIRLITNQLIVISPIQVDKATIDQLDEIGKVSYIIAPNLYHHLFVSEFKSLYPQAKLWVPPKFNLKKPNIPADKIIVEDKGNILEEVDYLLFDGFKIFDLSGPSILNEFVFFHRASQTLILTDTAFHFDDTFSFKTRLAAKFMGAYSKLSPSIFEKLAINEKEKVKKSAQKLLEWNFQRVIMAHGTIVERDGKKMLKEGYEQFLGTSL
ncbi:MAG: DUF4336 domain-containing protein [Scytonematopsis contorta HA4267-MV1]|jgi:hypothetical protein|nr:DUF4336 domain-containing protein [Scytonematopsis contorta HA4267-MV1]